MSKLLKALNITCIQHRGIARVRHFNWRDEGIQYPGFKYYPRHPDFKDPPYDPSKLFRVQRIKKLKGVPFYEKKILQEFGLIKRQSDVSIVKNIPENNARLWKIKHLVEIQPITFPDGFPEDGVGAHLQENGEFRVNKTVFSEEKLQLAENFKKDAERMDGDTLRRDSRKKWMSGW